MAEKRLLSSIQQKLGVEEFKSTSMSASGCINKGIIYNTENGKVFIKINTKEGSSLMFRGEFESLSSIGSTGCIKVPKPFCHLDDEESPASAIAMECLELVSSGDTSEKLGHQLADLHLHNIRLKEGGSRVGAEKGYVSSFGFPVATCCGFLPQTNEWTDDWCQFFAQKMDYQINKLGTNTQASREASELWLQLQQNLPHFFKSIEVLPSLLHGDLWSGNTDCVMNEEGEVVPVIYDAASFYGHHEYDLAIAKLFGGFSKNFWTAYHSKIPKENGFDSRSELYQLFHYLNHWNHFGSGYSGSSLSSLRNLVSKKW